MSTSLIKIRKFSLFIITFLIVSCSSQKNNQTINKSTIQPDKPSELITNNEISQPNTYSISKFILNQLDEEGNPHFSLTSSKAVVNPITGDMDATDIVINIEGEDLLFNVISASNCIIDKEKNLISLQGQVKLSGFRDEESNLTADFVEWDINAERINVIGNIKLNYLLTRLTSSKATYDLKSEQFIFTGFTTYNVFADNSNINPLIKLESNFAKIDNKTKKIEFYSKSRPVRSIINLGIK